MTVYFLGCAIAGIIIGMIAMYFIYQPLIGKLAINYYFLAKCYLSLAGSLTIENEEDKIEIGQFLDEVEKSAYIARSMLSEKYHDELLRIDEADGIITLEE